MFDNMQEYQKILDNIVARSNGDYIRMTYSEKQMVILIFREYKKAIDQFLRTEYPKIESWAELDLETIQLEETEPDFNKFSDIDFVNEFNKLMR